METQIRNPKLEFGPVSVSGFDSKFRFRVPISDFEFLILFDPDVLALQASLVLTGQTGFFIKWKCRKPAMFYFL